VLSFATAIGRHPQGFSIYTIAGKGVLTAPPPFLRTVIVRFHGRHNGGGASGWRRRRRRGGQVRLGRRHVQLVGAAHGALHWQHFDGGVLDSRGGGVLHVAPVPAGARVIVLGDDRGSIRAKQLDVGVIDVAIAGADDGPEVVGGAGLQVDLEQLTCGLWRRKFSRGSANIVCNTVRCIYACYRPYKGSRLTNLLDVAIDSAHIRRKLDLVTTCRSADRRAVSRWAEIQRTAGAGGAPSTTAQVSPQSPSSHKKMLQLTASIGAHIRQPLLKFLGSESMQSSGLAHSCRCRRRRQFHRHSSRHPALRDRSEAA
jgi:hypothetical protein